MTQATMPTQPPQVFLVGCRSGENRGASPDAMGFKAYNLWRMHGVGLKVPQAFVLGTRYCRDYLEHGRTPPADETKRVGGYLGCDFMLANDAVIDFGTGTLLLRPPTE